MSFPAKININIKQHTNELKIFLLCQSLFMKGQNRKLKPWCELFSSNKKFRITINEVITINTESAPLLHADKNDQLYFVGL